MCLHGLCCLSLRCENGSENEDKCAIKDCDSKYAMCSKRVHCVSKAETFLGLATQANQLALRTLDKIEEIMMFIAIIITHLHVACMRCDAITSRASREHDRCYRSATRWRRYRCDVASCADCGSDVASCARVARHHRPLTPQYPEVASVCRCCGVAPIAARTLTA